MIRIYSIGLILLTALLLLPLTVFAQKTRVHGTATYNGIRPLANVNISLDGTYDGATTDDKGQFAFETEEKGLFTVVAKVTGFVNVTQPVELNGAASLAINLVFTTKAVTLNDVTVRPRLFDLTDKNKYTVLSPLDVLTTATDGNITSALKTMPGAQPVGESGDLFVRGGTGTETKVYIDGLLVNNFTYSSPSNMAARSRFAPGMFKGTFFSTGGYSAPYGQALSSALILETEELPVKSSAELTISPIMTGANLEKLSRDKKTAYGGGVSHTTLGLYNMLAPGAVLFTKTPRFWDGNGFVRRQLNNGGMLKFFINGGISAVGLDRPNLDYDGVINNIRLTNRNLYTNLTYRQHLSGGWKWQAGLSYGHNSDLTSVAARVDGGFRPDSLVRQADQSSLWQARSVFSKLILDRTRLYVGTELQRISEQRNSSRYVDTFLAQFAETESYLTDRLSARIGLRLEYSSVLRQANVAPRLALGYSTGTNGLLSVSYGRFYQKPERQFLWQTTDLGYARADHYIASYQQLANDRTFRAEAYYKRYNNLIRTTPTPENSGWGYARGVEVFFRDKKSIKGVDYWLSYSFLDTKRQFLDYPTAVQPSFAARHTASAVVKRFFSGIQTNIGLSYTYGSGRPYANPNRPADSFMTDRTPAYHNLGLSIAHLMSIRKAQSVLVLTVSNALGNRQVFGYTYSARHPERREAIVPTNNPFIFVGMFVTLGADRRQEIINSQL
ncbi:TonB-dependent receptor plug [Fibrisoma limi BUZ 3]|uniref:TonB-dependent receptor plug n=1 Tax=Fibrisoma limi BUZ 3 TaxID=1185876 RepID=I2GFP1_9BACT|nr:TonB-dependent receptor [Fibrisoma limi]CCH52716.1 TonB-dependent receptor plug [Fibrisoma limi BUZ 3]